jgi:peptidyl-prolyl cis-trans isomerase B (cyclophilin B)
MPHCGKEITMKKIIALILATLCALSLVSCYQGYYQIKPEKVEGATNYVQIEMENGEIIKIELYPDVAPITVGNFKKLVSEGFYDGLTFHRVISDFVIQTGDPDGDGTGGSEKTIKGEFRLNGFENNLKHICGVVSMARLGHDMNSASSQIFICTESNQKAASLNGGYAGFGYVVSGIEVVKSIAKVPTGQGDKPLTDVVIEKACFVNVNQ